MGMPRRCSAASTRRSVSGLAKENSSEMATASAPLPRICVHQSVQFLIRRRAQHFAFGAHPFRHAEAQLARHQAYRHGRKPVVELAARLAADGDGVLKARRRHKRDARACPLQHGVGSHRRAVAHIDVVSAAPIRANAFEHRPRGIGGRRKQLQDLELSVSEVDAIGKRAAGVDRYAQISPPPHSVSQFVSV